MRKSRLVIRAHRDHIEIVRTIFLCKVALVDQSWYNMTIFDTVCVCVREIDSEKVRECVWVSECECVCVRESVSVCIYGEVGERLHVR